MRKKWIIIIVILLLAGLLIGLRACFQKKAQTPGNAQDTNKHTVAVGDIDSRIEITGEIQPQTVVSRNPVSGKVVKFYADENDYVKKGDIIADIEPDYNQANTLFNTKATLQRAELNLNRHVKTSRIKLCFWRGTTYLRRILMPLAMPCWKLRSSLLRRVANMR